MGKFIFGSLSTIFVAFLGCYMYDKGFNDGASWRWNK